MPKFVQAMTDEGYHVRVMHIVVDPMVAKARRQHRGTPMDEFLETDKGQRAMNAVEAAISSIATDAAVVQGSSRSEVAKQ
eukprot:1046080-Alexandrium_andersonii.AAC.1